jgi:hypothetical protein
VDSAGDVTAFSGEQNIMREGQVFVNAKVGDRMCAVDVFHLDDESFRAFVLTRLHYLDARLIVKDPSAVLQDEHSYQVRPEHLIRYASPQPNEITL